MKKVFLFAGLLVSTMLWAIKPENVIRVYMHPQGGYTIVDSNNDIIGMSDNEEATEVSEGVRNYFTSAGKYVEVLRQAMPSSIRMEAIVDSFGPVLGSIKYNQTKPYNNTTPSITDKSGQKKQCVTGCVATAMAQILAYWQWPKQCTDTVITYKTEKLGLQVSFDYGKNGTFDWENMLDTYDGISYTEEEAAAVAQLMSACGVSVEMNYTTETSGSFSGNVPEALVKIFKFKKGLKFQQREQGLTADEFSTKLRDEFKQGRPVYCSAQTGGAEAHSGHAFVIDGWKSASPDDSRKTYYHFNWGWGGIGNDWLKLTETEYNNVMQVILGAEPDRTTPVEETLADEKVQDNRIFDLYGREVSKTVRGNIYIQNGKKFLAQ